MEWLSNPETWISLVTLTVLEIVLGIDNIVFAMGFATAVQILNVWLRPKQAGHV